MRKSSTPGDVLQAVVAEVIFHPTEAQRKLKATLLAKLADNPLTDLSSLSLAEVQDITGSAVVQKWWSVPGFSDWLLDKNENRAKLEYLFSLALEAAEQVLMNTDPKAQSSRVAMIKTLAELAGKMPKAQTAAKQGANTIEAIASMDRTQLIEFLASRGLSATTEVK
jgi:hypothetical protein